MLTAIAHDGPVIYLEHKLLADYWLDVMGGAGRPGVTFDVPADGAYGEVSEPLQPVPLGRAATRRDGKDLALISVGVGVHRCLEAAGILATNEIEATVLDLRSVAPIDRTAIVTAGHSTGHVLAVDEDYVRGGLSGEVAAILAEERVDAAFGRVATQTTIPYARHAEDRSLPSVARIIDASLRLKQK